MVADEGGDDGAESLLRRRKNNGKYTWCVDYRDEHGAWRVKWASAKLDKIAAERELMTWHAARHHTPKDPPCEDESSRTGKSYASFWKRFKRGQ